MTTTTLLGWSPPAAVPAYFRPVPSSLGSIAQGITACSLPDGRAMVAWLSSPAVKFAVVDNMGSLMANDVITAPMVGTVVTAPSSVTRCSLYRIGSDVFCTVLGSDSAAVSFWTKIYKADLSGTTPTWSLHGTVKAGADYSSGPTNFAGNTNAGIPCRLNSGRWVLPVAFSYRGSFGGTDFVGRCASPYISDDGGVTWSKRAEFHQGSPAHWSDWCGPQVVREPTTGRLYMAVDDGSPELMARSDDGGTTWTQDSGTEPGARTMPFVDNGSLMYAVRLGVIYYFDVGTNAWVSTGKSVWDGSHGTWDSNALNDGSAAKFVVDGGQMFYFVGQYMSGLYVPPEPEPEPEPTPPGCASGPDSGPFDGFATWIVDEPGDPEAFPVHPGPPEIPDPETITASGVWTKPGGDWTTATITLIGGGGGGGSGAYRTNGASGGGGGGGGGGRRQQVVARTELGATEDVVIGGGGAGGARRTVTGGSNDGASGGASSFSLAPLVSSITAGGGGGGAGGGNSGSNVELTAAGGAGGTGTDPGGTGGGGKSQTPAIDGGAAAGGGGGGDVGAAPPQVGGDGGVAAEAGAGSPGGNNGSNGVAPTDGANATQDDARGSGGGGASGYFNVNGNETDRGGNGGLPGGGGGGGGGDRDPGGVAAGKGGNGARGQIHIVYGDPVVMEGSFLGAHPGTYVLTVSNYDWDAGTDPVIVIYEADLTTVVTTFGPFSGPAPIVQELMLRAGQVISFEANGVGDSEPTFGPWTLCPVPPALVIPPVNVPICQLGCPETRVYITDFCGGNILCDVTEQVTFLRWGRELDDVSEVEMTLHIKGDDSGAGCCECLSTARTWRNEVIVVRGGEIVWGPGPLVTIEVQRHIAHLVARDILAWLDVRLVHNDYNYVQADLGLIAEQIVIDALTQGAAASLPEDVRDCCILDFANFNLTGKFTDYEIKANRLSAGEILRELGARGLDFTVLHRSLIIGADFAFGPIGPLRDDHFQEDLLVTEHGLAAATKWWVSSDNAQGSCGGADSFFGLIERGVEGEPAATGSADMSREACDRLTFSNPPPVVVTVPSTGRLSPTAPVCPDVLVPGTLVDISIRELCRPADVRERLTAVRCTNDENGEAMGITVAPLGEFTVPQEEGDQ